MRRSHAGSGKRLSAEKLGDDRSFVPPQSARRRTHCCYKRLKPDVEEQRIRIAESVLS
jgi:hypothetical protein